MFGIADDKWQKTQAATPTEGGKQLPAGKYVCVIRKAYKDETKTGKPCVRFYFDIAEGEYSGFFTEKYKKKIEYSSNAKYPCIYTQCIDSERSIGFLKGIMQAIEESNKGYKCTDSDDEEKDIKSLRGKKVGVVFREEEFVGDNGVLSTSKPYSIWSVKNLENATVPEKKFARNDYGTSSAQQAVTDTIPGINSEAAASMGDDFQITDDEDLPF